MSTTPTSPSMDDVAFAFAADHIRRDIVATALDAQWRRQKFPTPPEYRGDTSRFDAPELSESAWAAEVLLLGEVHGFDLEPALGINRATLAVARAQGMTPSEVVHELEDQACPACHAAVAE